MSWKDSEIKCFQWFKENIDNQAELYGAEDSTQPDIYSPLYESYIEVKDITNGARCGQFTESTIKNNPYASNIYSGLITPEICKQFVKFHYEQKNVSHFIIFNNNEISFFTLENLFDNFTFEVQTPYAKRSGTRQAPKKDISILLDMDSEFFLGKDGKVYCPNPNRWGKYVSVNDTFDYYISKQNNGELRKRSNTQNLTWHLLIKKS